MKLTKSSLIISSFILAMASCASNPDPVAPAAGGQNNTVRESPAQAAAPSASAYEDEYKRSVSAVEVSVEQFELDKRIIMSKITELDIVMEGKDYKRWLSYLDPESVNYWSKKANLQKASKRLPIKGMKLNSLEDYFKFVFIPARAGKRVDEIRYETLTQIKAVQVNDDSDTIYYNFEKINGEWKVSLPPLDD